MLNVLQENSLMATYSRFPLTVVKGKGSYIWDDKGHKYLDFTSGIATCNLGHVPDEVKNAIKQQLEELWHCSNLYSIPNQEKLAKLLTENSFADQVFFCNSGAEANEAAIKLARIYSKKLLKNNQAFEVVTFKQSFHGRTLATLAATGQEKVQDGFAPLMPGFRYLPFNDMASLSELVQDQTCAVLLELVQGEGGVTPADKEWVKKIEEICKENNLLLMIDEVQTGMGRTGSLFAYEQYDVEPDVVTAAKGLGSGIPIGAVLAKANVSAAFTPGTHGSTFGGNPISTAAGAATLQYMLENDIVKNVQEMNSYFVEQLKKLISRSAKIEGIRCLGLMLGIVLKSEYKAIDLIDEARSKGVLILSAGEQVIRILPPLTVSKDEIDEFIAAFAELI